MKLSTLAFAALTAFGAAAQAATATGPTISYNGHDYTLLTADDWAPSEAYAISQGGHLVSIDDAAENNFILGTFRPNGSIWLGLERVGAGNGLADFAWTNGSASTFRNWAGGEPNNAGGIENAVHMYGNGQWNDLAGNNNNYDGAKYGVMEVTAVPEPETYALMLAGLASIGFVSRRRKAQAA
jgi:hypothetical protein